MRTKLTVKHSKDCTAQATVEDGRWKTPWYCPNGFRNIPGTVNRDSIGRRLRGLGERWLVLRCNSAECCAEMLVALEDVLELVERADPNA